MGKMIIDEPVPDNVPPQDCLYQNQFAPPPSEPPFSVRCISPLYPNANETESAATEGVLKVVVAEIQVVVPQVEMAFTQYVVGVNGIMLMVAPEPALVPPHDTVYQNQFPDPAVPPVTFIVVATPLHTVSETSITALATEGLPTITSLLTQDV